MLRPGLHFHNGCAITPADMEIIARSSPLSLLVALRLRPHGPLVKVFHAASPRRELPREPARRRPWAGSRRSHELHCVAFRRRRVRPSILCFFAVDGQPALCYNTCGGCRV